MKISRDWRRDKLVGATWTTRRVHVFGKPAPKLENKAGSYFPWSKQFITWAVTSTCDDALTETSDPIILQGPHATSRGALEIRHGPNKVASARRAFEGITAAVTHNSPLLRKIQEIGSPGLAMAEIRRHYVPSDDLDKQACLREYINAEMVEGEEPALYFCLLYTSPSPRDRQKSRMPSSA